MAEAPPPAGSRSPGTVRVRFRHRAPARRRVPATRSGMTRAGSLGGPGARRPASPRGRARVTVGTAAPRSSASPQVPARPGRLNSRPAPAETSRGRILTEVRQQTVEVRARRWLRQVRLEDLARGPVTEASPGRVVEPVGEPPEAGRRERTGLGLARQEAPDPPVRVLDAALLPGAVRVAEVAGHRQLPIELRVSGELAAAVEGDGPARGLGQGPERVADAGDHRRRALVLVRQQEGEAALPLHERGHVRLAGLLAEDQQVALPMPEGLPIADLGRSILDPALARDRGAAGLAAVAGPAPPARLRQVVEEAILPAFRAVDVAVDRLVADHGSLGFAEALPPRRAGNGWLWPASGRCGSPPAPWS